MVFTQLCFGKLLIYQIKLACNKNMLPLLQAPWSLWTPSCITFEMPQYPIACILIKLLPFLITAEKMHNMFTFMEISHEGAALRSTGVHTIHSLYFFSAVLTSVHLTPEVWNVCSIAAYKTKIWGIHSHHKQHTTESEICF